MKAVLCEHGILGRSFCIECRRARGRAQSKKSYAKLSREDKNKRNAQLRQSRNNDAFRASRRTCAFRKKRNKYQNESLRPRYSAYKYGKRKQKRTEVDFTLTLEQFADITSQVCHYCDGYSPGHDFCGVDRVDNDKGYVADNCVPCCSTCNFMKRNLTKEQFLEHVERIHNKTERSNPWKPKNCSKQSNCGKQS